MRSNYGLIMTMPDGETYKLYFTDDEHWGDDWDFDVMAQDDAGKEVCITYTAPQLDRDGEEPYDEYLDRCVEAIDWTRPDYIEDIDGDPETPYHFDADTDDATFKWF